MHEGTGSADGGAAAGRLYESLASRLGPLIGVAGVRALFARSVKLTKADYPCLADVRTSAQPSQDEVEPAPQLVACLSKLEPAVAASVAVALYATFLRLMSEFIGERLVRQVVRRAFPAIDQSFPKKETE